ncbi:TPA: hypothetical protein DDW69_03685 [candidate division CPR2 bacterium]|uniref:Uncharacterized protein n=1 Tax=candidate division CPR2 bacterium GW2011_GWC1_41_48 TaxID=1618344 RepID=A0A0G0W7M4_UNCC2|nr:MAG: hypothetical protein UT47_C0003G0070 [candidate division CPR2 bacterium GW2011_GWC2_39_35]KKR29354.1 MAG: hypothetical protein UT60_C0003G0031 [candidate division CPR2 bacterium GW2011_GWD2_39_7]KKS09009.1 MAG: hypothetical protein UU65_C0003G0064 [candidate division CPR2 bacterium GW2011_GWC1_41_48]OGB71176.1 MAG: hypothetical protein A2Y26_04160 [candidate division CPR2 bacterium GWD2_39_7]HBG81916.1 hypothetical protein [candidate division CPR2 bacterium]
MEIPKKRGGIVVRETQMTPLSGIISWMLQFFSSDKEEVVAIAAEELQIVERAIVPVLYIAAALLAIFVASWIYLPHKGLF